MRPTLRAAAALFLAALGAGCSDPQTTAVVGEIDVPVRRFDFGEVPVLNARVQGIDVNNIGRADLVVDRASIKEADAPFAVDAAPQTLAGGTTEKVVVSFRPPEQKDYRATLVIESEDLEQPVVEVELVGRGSTVAKMEVDPSIDFLLVCEGTSDVKRITVRSTGTADLILESIVFKEGTAPEFQFVSSTKTPATVAKGQEILLTIRYSPVESSPAESTGAVVITGTDPSSRTVEIPLTGKVNRAPVAVVATQPISAPGATVSLDGTGSIDPDDNLPLLFAWTLRTSPLGSRSAPDPIDTVVTSLVLDLPGLYTAELVVRDSLGCFSKPAFADVVAKPAEQLLVEVAWNLHDADLDLHMAPEGEAFFGPRDCYFAEGHMRPDWGVLGDASDDPSLSRDALTGFGPEIISYPTPASGRYQVMVDYYSAHGSKTPATEATLRVYEFGVVKRELRQTLPSAGKRWTVLSIEWPSGTITPIDTLE